MADVISYDPHLNEVIELLFEYINWMTEYDAAETDAERSALQGTFSPAIEAMLLENKEDSENYFSVVLDQGIYNTDDYLKFRTFLIYWYAGFKTLNYEEKTKSDIDIVDKDLLLQSLGYTLYYLHNDANKKILSTTISDLYSIKGSPLSIQQAFTLLGLNNFTIYEYWLYVSSDNTTLYLQPEAITDTSLVTSFDNAYNFLTKSLSSVTVDDPHWYYTESEIISINDSEPLGLPSLTPYIGLASANDWIYQSKLIMSRTSRIIKMQYNELINNNIQPPKIYYFSPLDSNLSILEIVLSLSYLYNTIYGRTNEPQRNGIDEFIYQFQGDKNILTDDVVFINEFNDAFRVPKTKQEREDLLEQEKHDWMTLQKEIGFDHNDLITILTNNFPELKNKLDEYISASMGVFALKEILGLFDLYVRYDMGIANYSALYMIEDPLSGQEDAVKKVLDFFKPYQTRLIEYSTYLIINDIPGNYFLMDDSLFLIIKQYINDVYDQLVDGPGPHITVFQKFKDIIGFESFSPENRYLYDILWFDLIMLTINQYIKEVYIDVMDDRIQINMQKILTSYYNNLINDQLKLMANLTFKDRINYNNSNAIYDYLCFDTFQLRNKNKYFDSYTSYYNDSVTIQEIIL